MFHTLVTNKHKYENRPHYLKIHRYVIIATKPSIQVSLNTEESFIEKSEQHSKVKILQYHQGKTFNGQNLTITDKTLKPTKKGRRVGYIVLFRHYSLSSGKSLRKSNKNVNNHQVYILGSSLYRKIKRHEESARENLVTITGVQMR